MINLIPNEEKKKMSKDFYFRFISLSLIMLGISFLVASVAILPSYFFVSIEKNTLNIKLESQKNDITPASDQDALLVINDLKSKLSLIEKAEQNKFLFSEKVINEILSKKSADIKITGISYGNNTLGKKIDLTGVASSRETLLLFSKALEDDPAFSKVDLPISNFVKGSNISFNLSLIPS